MKRCSTLLTSLVFRETYCKTMMEQVDIHIPKKKKLYTSIRTSKMKSVVKDLEKLELYTLLIGI